MPGTLDSMFIFRLLLSFILAGTWISCATIIGEKLGSKKGGLITNLPSAIVISFIFISLSQGIDYTVSTTIAIPVGMGIDLFFLMTFIIFIRKGLALAMGTSLGVWFIMAALMNYIKIDSWIYAIIFYIAATLITFGVVEFGLKIHSVPKKEKKVSWYTILIRALFAGFVVSGTILVSKFAPPYFVGIISCFPAVLLSTMVILSISQGADFARATGKVLILSSSNIIIYALVCSITFPIAGLWLGTLIAFTSAFFWLSIFLPIIRKIK